MNTLDRSLCRTCRYKVSCSLTSNKSFIWSCSEYELAQDTVKTQEPQVLTNKLDLVIEESIIELN